MDRIARTRSVRDGLLVVGWAGVIWVLGSSSFSASDTSRILGPLLEWLLPSATVAARADLAGLIRKAAHVVEYGVFAVLVVRFAYQSLSRCAADSPPHRAFATACAAALGAAALLATLDESRQAALSNRTGSPFDVGLDIFGAALAIVIAATVSTWLRRPTLGVPGWPQRPAPRADAVHPRSSEPPGA